MQDREQEIAQAERLTQALRDLRAEQLMAEGTGGVVETLLRELAARDEMIADLRAQAAESRVLRFRRRAGA